MMFCMGNRMRSCRREMRLVLALLIGLWVVVANSGRASRGNGQPEGLGGGLKGGLIITGATPHRLIHFTFDDGPDPELTPRLLDKLDTAGVKATFFFSASRFRAQRRHSAKTAQIAREVLRRGHSVGSHSVIHRRMARMNGATLRDQLEESDRLFRRVFGFPTHLFRPPFGSRARRVDRMLAARGYTTVLWNIGMADWVSDSAPQVLQTFRRVMARVQREKGQRGGVVLLHDTHSWSVDAFELIHAHLLTRNCELLARSEELYDIVPDLSLFFVPRGASQPPDFAPEAPSQPEVFAARQAQLRRETKRRCGQTSPPSAQ